MKLLHLADLHLGRRLCEQSLLEDQREMLQGIATACAEEGVDAVLICGDVYDKAVPAAEAVALLDAFLTRLIGQGQQVFVISGNHDSAERLHFASSMLSASGLHMTARYDGEMPVATLEDAHGPVHIWRLPFVRASTIGHYHPQADTRTMGSALQAVIEGVPVDRRARNVLLMHQLVMGGAAPPALAGSEGFAHSVGTLDPVSAQHLEAFDYVALGHIHRPQQVGRETVRYAGSPLAYSLSEAGQPKSMPLVTLGAKGAVEVRLLPLTPARGLRHLTGPIAALLSPENITEPDDYLHITLTDAVPVLDALAQLRAVYPNTLHLDYAGWEAMAEGLRLEDIPQRSLTAHFAAFYEALYARPPEAEATDLVAGLVAEMEGESV